MKVLMFAKEYPAYHPRKGERTYFVQKILHSQIPAGYIPATDAAYPAKFHTIRAGNRWKVGDKISARVWTDKPYRSKQHEFAQLEVKKTWPIEVEVFKTFGYAIYVGKLYVCDWEITTGNNYLSALAANDGLTKEDFLSWFKLDNEKPKPFVGQIICWNESIEYRTTELSKFLHPSPVEQHQKQLL